MWKPKYKIGTLLRDKHATERGEPHREQIMIIGHYSIVEQNKTHEGLIVENEVKMYNLMYLGEKGRRAPQTERWLETLIKNKKLEVVAIPN